MDKDFFLKSADRYKDTVYRIALNYLRNTYDADDILQEVLLKFYTSHKKFDCDEHIKNWLIRVTINMCKNTLRVPWRKRDVALDELTDSMSFEYEEESDLFEMVMGLPEKNRIVLYLFYYEDYSVKEIADMLKLKETAVTSRLSRARKQLEFNITEVS